MSKKNKKEVYAVFGPDQKGARIYVNPTNTEDLLKKGTVVKINDRDRKKLKGISPSDWELKGDKIVHAKSSDLYKEVTTSVHEHGLPEIQPIEIKQEYIIIEPDYVKMAALCGTISTLTTLLTFIGFLLHLGVV
jgi:hypothetical protein